jgi:hypothetical protein
MGKSYVMSALMFIPRAIWRTKPSSPKVEAGSILTGYSGLAASTRQYGLVGEAMLNFSYYGVVPAFLTFGIFIGWLRKKIATMNAADSRFFLIPVLIYAATFMFIQDSDNWMFYLVKMGTLPFIIVFFGSVRSPLIDDSM